MRRLARIGDALVPWAVAIFLMMVVIDEQASPTTWSRLIIGWALAIVSGAALHWRRRYPERVMVITLAAGLGFFLLIPEVVIPIAPLFAIGSLAAARPPRISLPALALLMALVAANFFTTTAADTFFTMGLAIGAWALGEAARSRRATASEEARRAVSEEQARIARELHDVIAHSVSVIVVQAAAADDVFEERPDQARAALRTIEQTGRDTLGELRRLLSAVRPVEGADPTGPQPGLHRLEELAEPLRAGGLEVVVHREGETAALPAGVELSAYRIVQEALTNTLRHARATRAEVTVRCDEEALEVDVLDDGRAAPSEGGGHGLVGMCERAALLGGTLEAGPHPQGGFRVHARLPLEAAPG